ncbi:hypothetical protein N7463_004919 [Penicillium fimorum]|uniref:Uncharacterized protein n=1 Tax=Penicillium fimorum TaxID=1882269 RepID=A0A9W9XRH9_9EURO|nr:hypothetical protein N7463_004919 [Penicillium fimorum]
MMPPSDSLRHHLHKLAEVRANRNASSISTSTSPTSPSTSTPRTAPPPYTLSVTRPSGTTVMSVDQHDMDDPWASPINIYIDNSITVAGDENTIAVSSPGSDSSIGAQTSPHLTSVAAVIIAALNRANALNDDMGYPRPINIRALAGIRVNGRNNSISVGGEVHGTQRETANPEAGESNRRKRRAGSVRTLLRKQIFKNLHH